MSAVVATSLTQRFGSEVALDGVDLAVDAGEHLAVLGENGAGKTTLLRILATAARGNWFRGPRARPLPGSVGQGNPGVLLHPTGR